MVKGTVKEFKILIKRNGKKLNVPVSTTLKHTGGVEVKLHSFLTSALDGGEWKASRAGRFTYGKEPRYSLKGGWVGTKAGLFSTGGIKSSCPCWVSNLSTFSP
jgi:hypothetical protein